MLYNNSLALSSLTPALTISLRTLFLVSFGIILPPAFKLINNVCLHLTDADVTESLHLTPIDEGKIKGRIKRPKI